MPVVLDESAFPVVRANFVGMTTDDELADYEARVLDLLQRCDARGERFALVTHGERSVPLTSRQRRMQADFVARHRDLAARVVAGNALVLRGVLHRGVLRVILWLVTPPYPLEVVSSMEEAEARAKAFLAVSNSDR